MSTTDLDRRTVLRMIAAGAAGAVAGCDRPHEPIVPYVDQPEGLVPGTIERYATALSLAGYGRGVTGLVVDGRPIKLEGLDTHPASRGATDTFTELSILDLYDPQRLKAPSGPAGITSWPTLATEIVRSAGDGARARILTGRITSPTVLARIASLKQRLPGLRHVRYEAFDDDNAHAGTEQAFGRPFDFRPHLDRADVVLALGADPLGPGPDQVALAAGWSDRRRAGSPPPKLYVAEPSMTLTGVAADRRAAAHPDEIVLAGLMLAKAMGAPVSASALSPPVAALMNAAVRDLLAARGRALVLVGRDQPAALHAFAAWANHRLAAPADWIAPVDPDPTPHGAGLAALVDEMHAGAVETLLMLDCNPVYHTPPALGFADALKRVPLSIAGATFPSETTVAAKWIAPLSHGLEVWGDLRGQDGTASIVQPLIRPLYDGRSALGILDLLDPRETAESDHARVQATWRSHAGRPHAPGDFDHWWTETLVAGVVAASAASPIAAPAPRLVLPDAPGAGTRTIVSVLPSSALWDGRYASNAWAQECPEPLTKEVWGSSLRVARADAERLGLDDGAVVRLGAIEAPARIVPGQAAGVMTMFAGYGRRDSGPIADGIGANAFALRGAPATDLVPKPTGRHAPVQSTQHFFELDGDLAKLFPVLAPGARMPAAGPLASVLPTASPSGPAEHAWAMVIDTSVCIGCNACVVACQAENNVPVIGIEEIAMGRDMHWLRVDRYDCGDGDDPRPGFQPVPCMQCEKAPCEPVCPVEASVHDAEGLNVQVYNRCIGTRTCQANCPYKVRRFNFLAYPDPELWSPYDPASLSAQRNPDVTVRARGVMEKCTYCLQRISTAKHREAATGAPIRDGDVVTACQAACPTRAITFGDLADPTSRVNAQKRDPRHYALLGELGTRPRTTYLAKVRATGDEA